MYTEYPNCKGCIHGKRGYKECPYSDEEAAWCYHYKPITKALKALYWSKVVLSVGLGITLFWLCYGLYRWGN
jgi:hypothetical protein